MFGLELFDHFNPMNINKWKIKKKSCMNIFRSVHSAFHPLSFTGILCVLGYVLTCLMLGLRLRHDLEVGTNKHTLAMHIASLFTCMSVPISFYLIYDHLSHFFQPKLQTQVIRIIFIVPIFAVESTLSIYFMEYAFYFQVVREFYESYVIYSFMLFLLYYLGDTEKIVQSLVSKPSSFGIHKQPFCCVSTWKMGYQFLAGCKTGVLQYVINRFVLTSMSLLLHVVGLYVEGDYSLDSPYLYLTIINSLSQTYALYSLFLFYYASSAEFKSIRPFEKFFSIKLIIFFSWWQGLLIGFLVNGSQIDNNFDSGSATQNSSMGSLDALIFSSARKINSGISADQHTTQHMADGIQDLLICMEMLIAAIAFTYSFPVADFAMKGVGSSGANMGSGEQHNNTDPPGLYTSTPSGVSGIRRRGGPMSHDTAGGGGTPGTLLQRISSSSGVTRNLSATGLEDEEGNDEDEEGGATEQRIQMLAQEGPAGDMKFLHSPSISVSTSRPLHRPPPMTTPAVLFIHDDSPESSSARGEDSSTTSETSHRPHHLPHHHQYPQHHHQHHHQHHQQQQQDSSRVLPKSLSTGSLYSSDNNSQRSSRQSLECSNPRRSKAHAQLSPLKTSPLNANQGSKPFFQPSRKYNWKEMSNHSLYNHSSLSNKAVVNNEPEETVHNPRSKSILQKICSFLLNYLDTCVVTISSLVYYFSSFFFEEDDSSQPAGVHDVTSDQHQFIDQYYHTNTNALFTKATTPQKYYDYHYYHAAPVEQQLQQGGEFTVLQAVYLTLSMGDLKGDMLELLSHLLDILIILPSLQLKRWIKSNAH